METMISDVFISVIVPVYNEEKYIEGCLQSLLRQDYPKERMEWYFVDGMSQDDTVALLGKYKSEYPGLIYILTNKYKTVPYAMNIGIKKAKGEYIIRLDAHAEYKPDYISKCVKYLKETGADNVGGIAITKGKGFTGKCIAKMLSSRFGVGNSHFRTNGESGYVDTLAFGAFRRESFEKYGYYDTRLTRNQDNELNYRIRKNGGKIYLSSDIQFTYYCRDTITGISDMAMKNGKWNVITYKFCPGSMSIRHFIPLVFVLSIIILLAFGLIIHRFFRYMLYVELLLYFILDVFFSFKSAKGLSEFFMLLFLFPIFHIMYGIGSLKGLFALINMEGNNKCYMKK